MEFKYNLMDFLLENGMVETIDEDELELYRQSTDFGNVPKYSIIEAKGYDDEKIYFVFQNNGECPFSDGVDLTQCDIEDEDDEETIMNTYFPDSPFATLEGVFQLKSKRKFYVFNQRVTQEEVIIDDERGIGNIVLIEANDRNHAIERAKEIGLDFSDMAHHWHRWSDRDDEVWFIRWDDVIQSLRIWSKERHLIAFAHHLNGKIEKYVCEPQVDEFGEEDYGKVKKYIVRTGN